MEPRTYLGDGVYVHFDGWHLWLTTSNGIHDTNSIALEPVVFEALTNYVEKLHDDLRNHSDES